MGGHSPAARTRSLRASAGGGGGEWAAASAGHALPEIGTCTPLRAEASLLQTRRARGSAPARRRGLLKAPATPTLLSSHTWTTYAVDKQLQAGDGARCAAALASALPLEAADGREQQECLSRRQYTCCIPASRTPSAAEAAAAGVAFSGAVRWSLVHLPVSVCHTYCTAHHSYAQLLLSCTPTVSSMAERKCSSNLVT